MGPTDEQLYEDGLRIAEMLGLPDIPDEDEGDDRAIAP